MPRERDEQGRFAPKKGETLDRVVSVRVTEHEYKAIKEAQKKGADPRKILVETVKQGNG